MLAGAAKSAIDNPAWNRAPMTDEKPRKSTKLVWIVWRDAVGGDRIHRDDIARARLAVNTNLGWIEHENSERIVLCHGYGNTGEYEYTQIPLSDIMERIPVVNRSKRRTTKRRRSTAQKSHQQNGSATSRTKNPRAS